MAKKKDTELNGGASQLAEGTYLLEEGEEIASQPEPLRPIYAVKLTRQGVKACGPYQAGRVYRVGEEVAQAVVLTNEVAHRLINCKGFEEINEEG